MNEFLQSLPWNRIQILLQINYIFLYKCNLQKFIRKKITINIVSIHIQDDLYIQFYIIFLKYLLYGLFWVKVYQREQTIFNIYENIAIRRT